MGNVKHNEFTETRNHLLFLGRRYVYRITFWVNGASAAAAYVFKLSAGVYGLDVHVGSQENRATDLPWVGKLEETVSLARSAVRAAIANRPDLRGAA